MSLKEIELWVSGPPHVVADLLRDVLAEPAGARVSDTTFLVPLGSRGQLLLQLRAIGRLESGVDGVRVRATIEEVPASRYGTWAAMGLVLVGGALSVQDNGVSAVVATAFGVVVLWGIVAGMRPGLVHAGEEQLRQLVRRVQELADHYAEISR